MSDTSTHVDLFGEPGQPSPVEQSALDQADVMLATPNDLDRLRLGLNGAKYDALWDEIRMCRRCFNSWPLLCEIHVDRVLYLDDEFGGC